MEIPPYLDQSVDTIKVCKLKKALYSLKQYIRKWFGRLKLR